MAGLRVGYPLLSGFALLRWFWRFLFRRINGRNELHGARVHEDMHVIA
jgi:hypothetical protein